MKSGATRLTTRRPLTLTAFSLSCPLPSAYRLLFDLQLERHDGERLVGGEAFEHGGALEDGSHLGGHRVDEGRALLFGLDAGGVLVVAAAEELLEEGARRGVDDAADALVGGNLRQLFGHLDGAVEAPELVNQPPLLPLRARPDAAARDLVDGLGALELPPCGHLRQELVPVEVAHL